jgi:hypothetical protein
LLVADNRGNLRGSAARSGGLVEGTNDFYKVSKALKYAGRDQLRKELHKAVRTAAKPLIPKVRAAAKESLPKKNQLNDRIAKKPFRAQTRTGERTAGVRIVGTKVDPRINQGRVWHPVFGRKGKPDDKKKKNSVVQQVPAAKGYFTDTLQNSAPEIRDDVRKALEDFTDRIVREAR